MRDFLWIIFLQPLYKLNYLIKILYNSSIICHTEAQKRADFVCSFFCSLGIYIYNPSKSPFDKEGYNFGLLLLVILEGPPLEYGQVNRRHADVSIGKVEYRAEEVVVVVHQEV